MPATIRIACDNHTAEQLHLSIRPVRAAYLDR